MARPKIVSETKRPLEEKEPPHSSGLEPHPWLSEHSQSEYRRRVRSGAIFDVYLSALGEGKIRSHAVKEAPRRLEVMGFLLGEACTWKGETYSVVRDVVTTELRSSSSKVRFDPKAFPKLFHELDDSGFDYILVGWYHSHPGHTCFLSGTDKETQRSMFNQPYHVALVIDPINRDVKTFRLRDDGYEETLFAVFDPSHEAASRPNGTRTRKLKATPGGHADH
jgi:proteasome lid subunit RPN8/RPN11